MRHGAGGLIKAQNTQRYLMGRRALRDKVCPGTWGTWGGMGEKGEEPIDTLLREIFEEAGFEADPHDVHWMPTFFEGKFRFYNAIVHVQEEFIPTLNEESDDYKWVKLGEWPEPLHYGARFLIGKL